MYKIKPYSEYIQSELLNFMNSEPNQWQAKVIACLGFRVIYSFEEITGKLSLSPVYILKTLLVAERYHVVTYTNDGWIINSHLDVNDLNEFLAIDIGEYDIGNSKRMSYLLEHGILDKKEQSHKDSDTSTRIIEEHTKPLTATKWTNRSGREMFDDIAESTIRPVDGSGRKKSKEWNQNEALDFGRELRRAIDERNKSGKDNRSKSLNTIFRSPKNNNKSIRRKKHFSKEDIASEKLYIKLCTFYPDYEAFITKQHEIDGSYKMMQLVKRKILNDVDDFGRRSH